MSDQISTSFNPTALLMVKSEIDNSIQQIETLISSLVEDQKLPFGLDDAVVQLSQCAKVLYLIDQPTLGKIIDYSAEITQQVMQTPEKVDVKDIHIISKSLLGVKRYIEFSCLEEKNVPAFLLEHLNELEARLNHPVTQEGAGLEHHFSEQPTLSIQIEKAEKSLYTHQLYKICLKQLLTQHLTGLDKAALIAVGQQLVHQSENTPSSNYWKFVYQTFNNIDQTFFSTPRLRTFIQIEKNIEHFFVSTATFEPTKSEFANVLRICLGQDSKIVEDLKTQLSLKQDIISDQALVELQQKLRAPDYETINAVVELLSQEITSVHQEVEFNYKTMNAERFQSLHKQLLEIRNTLTILNLNHISANLTHHLDTLTSVEQLQQDQTTQELMQNLLQALNELGLFIRKNTPDLLQRPVNNPNIALDRLDNAYTALAQELHELVEENANLLTGYHESEDKSSFEELPHALEEMAGASLFLFNSEVIYHAFLNCAKFVKSKEVLEENDIKIILSVCASIAVSLEEIANKQPVMFGMFDVALENSQKLQHAA